jgi:hypothetical protein
MELRKRDVIGAFDGNASELARTLGIRPQAVYGWPEVVPRGRAFELRVKRPDLFDASGAWIGAQKTDSPPPDKAAIPETTLEAGLNEGGSATAGGTGVAASDLQEAAHG